MEKLSLPATVTPMCDGVPRVDRPSTLLSGNRVIERQPGYRAATVGDARLSSGLGVDGEGLSGDWEEFLAGRPSGGACFAPRTKPGRRCGPAGTGILATGYRHLPEVVGEVDAPGIRRLYRDVETRP